MDHYQTPSKRETSSSIGVKFVLSFKTFLQFSLKIDLFCLFYWLALVKVTRVVKYEYGGQGSDLSKLPNERDAGMKRPYFSLSNDSTKTSKQFRRSTEAA